ncbi:MAG: hypothetical protein ONA90_10835 [candidate division KSB1 bacterium]|nr:hypothetical protein [candidate division KSB1 bacterium]
MHEKIDSPYLSTPILFLMLFAGLSNAGSIYSRHGIGLISYRDAVKATGMGGVSLAVVDSVTLFMVNPAALAHLRLTRVQADFLYERTGIHLTSGNGIFQKANVNSLALSFPFTRGYTMALGIQPYSRSNFQFSQTDSATTYEEIFNGSGGVNTAYFALAMTPISMLRLGIAVDFYFGQLRQTWRVNFVSSNRRNTEDVTNHHFKGVGLHGGVQAQFRKAAIGVAIGLPTTLNVETTLTTVTGIDSVAAERKARLPLWWGLGFGYAPNRHWMIAVDWRTQQWNAVKPEELLGALTTNSFDLGLGAEVTPSFNPLDGFLKRLRYRMGGSYRQLPYKEPMREKIQEWTASFGLGVPFGQGRNHIDFAVEAGKRGSIASNGASENVLLIHASISGSERWFQRGSRR